MVARVIHKLKAESIPYFQPVADTPGLARAVAATIAELRLEGMRPEQVAETGLPGRDLARMAALYEEELANRSAADFALLLRYAIAAAREGKHRLLGLPVVLLDVDLKRRCAAKLSKRVLAAPPAVFDARLIGAGSDRRPSASRPATTLDRIRESLFAETVSPDDEPDSSLDYFSAAGESLECVEIARRIRKIAADGDAPSTAWRSCCARRNVISRWWKKRCGGRASRRISAAASRVPIRRDGLFWPCWRAPAKAAPPRVSPNIFRWGRRRRSIVRPAAMPRRCRRTTKCSRDCTRARQPRRRPSPSARRVAEGEDAAVIGGTLQSPAAWEKLLVDAAVIGGRDRWAAPPARPGSGVSRAARRSRSKGRRPPPASGARNRPAQEPGALRAAADRPSGRAAAAGRLGRLDRASQRAGRWLRCAIPESVLVGAGRIAGHGRSGAGGPRRGFRRAERTPALSAPRAGVAPLWRRLRQRNRRSARARVRHRVSAGLMRRPVSQPPARRSHPVG